MLPDLADLVDYIVRQYPSASKIVEVGVGRFPNVALELKKRLQHTKIIVVDVNDSIINNYRDNFNNIEFLKDDVFEPKGRIYQSASLIYSIRPPPELHEKITEIGMNVKADVLIRTFDRESLSTGINTRKFSLINNGKASFYIAFFQK